MNEDNPFKQMKDNDENDERTLPEGVVNRLEKQAERTGEDYEKVLEFFKDYIKTHYECSDWRDEDDDLLEDCLYKGKRSNSVPLL